MKQRWVLCIAFSTRLWHGLGVVVDVVVVVFVVTVAVVVATFVVVGVVFVVVVVSDPSLAALVEDLVCLPDVRASGRQISLTRACGFILGCLSWSTPRVSCLGKKIIDHQTTKGVFECS